MIQEHVGKKFKKNKKKTQLSLISITGYANNADR